MIGQHAILHTVDLWIRADQFPRFVILMGERGSGRTTLAKEMARRMRAYLIECELSVDAVREAVKNCYKCSAPTVYLFRNADRMSTAAKNAMLKITEEPPRQAHFILTVSNSGDVLDTLRSRATNILMNPYTTSELTQFYDERTRRKNPLIREVCHVPGLMLEMEKIDIEELLSFCASIIDHIQEVTGVNAFKIVQRIKLKEDGPGYDPELFFCCMKYSLSQRLMCEANSVEDQVRYARMLNLVYRTHLEFNISGLKKDATLDMWILEMREC